MDHRDPMAHIGFASTSAATAGQSIKRLTFASYGSNKPVAQANIAQVASYLIANQKLALA
jgi:hypothetical protein